MTKTESDTKNARPKHYFDYEPLQLMPLSQPMVAHIGDEQLPVVAIALCQVTQKSRETGMDTGPTEQHAHALVAWYGELRVADDVAQWEDDDHGVYLQVWKPTEPAS